MFNRMQIQLLTAAGVNTEKLTQVLVAEQLGDARLKAQHVIGNALNNGEAGLDEAKQVLDVARTIMAATERVHAVDDLLPAQRVAKPR